MSKKFILSRWIPFIFHLEEIKEDPPCLCVWNGTILVLIFLFFLITFLIGGWPILQTREVSQNNSLTQLLLWNSFKATKNQLTSIQSFGFQDLQIIADFPNELYFLVEFY
jgi:hypothetical protein